MALARAYALFGERRVSGRQVRLARSAKEDGIVGVALQCRRQGIDRLLRATGAQVDQRQNAPHTRIVGKPGRDLAQRILGRGKRSEAEIDDPRQEKSRRVVGLRSEDALDLLARVGVVALHRGQQGIGIDRPEIVRGNLLHLGDLGLGNVDLARPHRVREQGRAHRDGTRMRAHGLFQGLLRVVRLAFGEIEVRPHHHRVDIVRRGLERGVDIAARFRQAVGAPCDQLCLAAAELEHCRAGRRGPRPRDPWRAPRLPVQATPPPAPR